MEHLRVKHRHHLRNQTSSGKCQMMAIICSVCILFTLFPRFGYTQDGPLAKRLAQVVKESPINGSVMVTLRGQTLLASGYGVEDRKRGSKNKVNTKHRIGSITKQFTAMAILILEKQGKLKVEDPVSKHVADLPTTWRPLTIHQLLTHTAGMPHSWAVPQFAQNQNKPASLDETLEKFHDSPLLFKPGTNYKYSGTGYFLLAKVIEEVSGETYAAFLRKEIFDPLKMADTGADHPRSNLKNRATGYETNKVSKIVDAPLIYMPILTGGGNLYSTVADLARWDRALHAKLLLSEAGYEKLFKPEKNNYAYGWSVILGNKKRTFHGGGVSGFSSFILRYPDEELLVAVLSNVRSKESVRTLGNRLAGEVLRSIDK